MESRICFTWNTAGVWRTWCGEGMPRGKSLAICVALAAGLLGWCALSVVLADLK